MTRNASVYSIYKSSLKSFENTKNVPEQDSLCASIGKLVRPAMLDLVLEIFTGDHIHEVVCTSIR